MSMTKQPEPGLDYADDSQSFDQKNPTEPTPIDSRIITEFNELYARIRVLTEAINALSNVAASHQHSVNGVATLPASIGIPRLKPMMDPKRG